MTLVKPQERFLATKNCSFLTKQLRDTEEKANRSPEWCLWSADDAFQNEEFAQNLKYFQWMDL